MTIAFPALTVAFAAFCVWLTVRRVNRRERWAKWVLIAVILLPVFYVASFGPACWWFAEPIREPAFSAVTIREPPVVFKPFGWLLQDAPHWLVVSVNWYATLGIGNDAIICGYEEEGESFFWAGFNE